MTWTKKQPTRAGWYWYQATYSHPEIVKLYDWLPGQPLLLERINRPPSRIPDCGRWSVEPIDPPNGGDEL